MLRPLSFVASPLAATWSVALMVAVAAANAAPSAQTLAGVAEPAAAAPYRTAQAATARKQPRPRQARPSPPPPAPAYGDDLAVQAFADALAGARELPREWVRDTLAQARRIERVRDLVRPAPPGTAKDWSAYRARFVAGDRIDAGVAFWRAHDAPLAEAQARWGVPAELIVAIVGVETFYGRFTGGFRVLDALATLAFDYPAGPRDRSAFFRDELGEFLVLCRREGLDATAVRGSYAGAMGLPQFMPSSWNRDALDFDGDGRVDLHGSAADAVGSVAQFLARHGWRRGMPTHFAVAPPMDDANRAGLLAPDIVPSFGADEMERRGARLDDAGRAHRGALALVELHNGALAPSYVAGTDNFYVVTRYNRSSYYALAVLDLADALRAAHDAAAPPR